MEGRIKKLVIDRGFGFIGVDGEKDVFFHRSSLVDGNFDMLDEGTPVTFEIEDSPRGPRAKEVKAEE